MALWLLLHRRIWQSEIGHVAKFVSIQGNPGTYSFRIFLLLNASEH